MELVIRLILILASIDFVLTLFWIYRWQSSKFLKNHKLRVPVRIIEANPIVNHMIKNFGVYPGTILGYPIVVLIQFAIARIHNILAWIVFGVILWAVTKHTINNFKTPDKHIKKMTRAYNKKMTEKK